MRIYLALSFLFVLAGCALASSSEVPIWPKPVPTPPSAEKGKKNVRPGSDAPATDRGSLPDDTNIIAGQPAYFYEFTRPGFAYSQVLIEHDEEGRGKISFVKDGFDEAITDPIALSPATVGRINESLTELNFLNSTEEYQYERDFSNLGNVTITVRKDGRERKVKYNWTNNKSAKDLMDEYRRISNEYIWRFEFSVARQNQPLRTPGMMDSLDSYLRRNEVSDPPHLVPLLTAISTDERLPLITRNRALKLTEKIAKSNK